jgi:hypothetical protein
LLVSVAFGVLAVSDLGQCRTKSLAASAAIPQTRRHPGSRTITAVGLTGVLGVFGGVHLRGVGQQ